MLTLPEKILFVLAALVSLVAFYRAVRRIVLTLSRGHGKPDWSLLPKRLVTLLPRLVILQPTFKIRLLPSLFQRRRDSALELARNQWVATSPGRDWPSGLCVAARRAGHAYTAVGRQRGAWPLCAGA